MKRYDYALYPALPALTTSLTPLFIFIGLAIFSQEKAARMARWIVLNAFSAFISLKTEGGNTKCFLRDLDLTASTQLLQKVFGSLFGLFFVMFTLASSLFWQTLLLNITYSCKSGAPDMECFAFDVKDNLEFWKAFERLSEDPISCDSPGVLNGTVSVVCYQWTFNIGAASGASYGGFKLAVIGLNIATSAMLLHKRPKSVTRTRIIVGVVMLVMYAVFIAVRVVERANGSSSFTLTFDSHSLAIYLQVLLGTMAVLSFVFYTPWKDLIELQEDLAMYEPILGI